MKLRDRFRNIKNLLHKISNALFFLIKYDLKKITYYDVGAMGGISLVLRILQWKGMIDLYLFEPNKDEAIKLKKKYKDLNIIEKALGDKDENRNLYITSNPGCSSLLKPDTNEISEYPIKKWFEVVKIKKVETTKLDSILKLDKIAPPNILKMDIQGFEFEVLNSFSDEIFKDLICIELEVQFKRLYTNQKLFDDIYKLLIEKGYILYELESQGPYEGELLEANCFFAKKNVDLSNEKQDILNFFLDLNGIKRTYLKTGNHKFLKSHLKRHY